MSLMSLCGTRPVFANLSSKQTDICVQVCRVPVLRIRRSRVAFSGALGFCPPTGTRNRPHASRHPSSSFLLEHICGCRPREQRQRRTTPITRPQSPLQDQRRFDSRRVSGRNHSKKMRFVQLDRNSFAANRVIR